ncbi:MAG: hypothetical protein JRL30_20275 [Deltaproteobacteria bacterium]|nr:hypothetical protein [Deltaproteobacteria bacterium]
MRKKWDDEQKCKYCGGKYIPDRGTQLFCCIKCRRKWYRKHPDEIQRIDIYHKICPECGDPFDTPYPFKVYDKKECRWNVNSRRKYHEDKKYKPKRHYKRNKRKAERRKEWGKEKLAKGLCGRCGKNPLVYQTLCGKCYEYLKSRIPINR